ncbi:hypothetical protein BpHYR1_042540 [Brachionus plicatilis]|uniref:Uncharacterized protein n=1 Tax=Brachionus plicatilis TaxID=10195 RepID=A0A3M7SZQ8_BRAPC|nr:hypothetical protein BpHYR1_042540 [Brachionus plicatilis]
MSMKKEIFKCDGHAYSHYPIINNNNNLTWIFGYSDMFLWIGVGSRFDKTGSRPVIRNIGSICKPVCRTGSNLKPVQF